MSTKLCLFVKSFFVLKFFKITFHLWTLKIERYLFERFFPKKRGCWCFDIFCWINQSVMKDSLKIVFYTLDRRLFTNFVAMCHWVSKWYFHHKSFCTAQYHEPKRWLFKSINFLSENFRAPQIMKIQEGHKCRRTENFIRTKL